MTPIERIKELRARTNAPLGACKEAFDTISPVGYPDRVPPPMPDEEFFAKAIEWLRVKGTLRAEDIKTRWTNHGAVVTYVHPERLLATMVQVDCQTDFVAKSDAFLAFCHDLALHIAASKPLFVNSAEARGTPWALKESDIILSQMQNDPKMANKPIEMKDKIAEGKLEKVIKQACLLDQPFVKDTTRTVGDLLGELVLKTGEAIKVVRFSRFDVCEGKVSAEILDRMERGLK